MIIPMDDSSPDRQQLLFKAIAEHSNAVIVAKSLDGEYLYVNSEFSRLFHLSSDEIIGRNAAALFPPEVTGKLREADLEVQQSNKVITVEEEQLVDGKRRHYLSAKFPIRDHEGSIWATGLVATDITKRKELEMERDKLVAELQGALAQIKLLSGCLPICASCKKIRDDQGYWNQIETYIEEHSEADFTHGICPECAKKLYPDHRCEDESPKR